MQNDTLHTVRTVDNENKRLKPTVVKFRSGSFVQVVNVILFVLKEMHND